MDVLITNLPRIFDGFLVTVQLFLFSGVIALVAGTALAAMRVSPVPVFRATGTAYVTIFRNTPLVILFVIFVAGLPFVGFQLSFFTRAVIALSVYTTAFVCEAVRSGVNAVQVGQAEAARAIGMSFGRTLTHVVLPQAFRSVVPPLTSVFIALVKNTAVAEVFGVTEASYQLDSLVRDFPGALWWFFAGIAGGYMAVVLVIAQLGAAAERQWAVAR